MNGFYLLYGNAYAFEIASVGSALLQVGVPETGVTYYVKAGPAMLAYPPMPHVGPPTTPQPLICTTLRKIRHNTQPVILFASQVSFSNGHLGRVGRVAADKVHRGFRIVGRNVAHSGDVIECACGAKFDTIVGSPLPVESVIPTFPPTSGDRLSKFWVAAAAVVITVAVIATFVAGYVTLAALVAGTTASAAITFTLTFSIAWTLFAGPAGEAILIGVGMAAIKVIIDTIFPDSPIGSYVVDNTKISVVGKAPNFGKLFVVPVVEKVASDIAEEISEQSVGRCVSYLRFSDAQISAANAGQGERERYGWLKEIEKGFEQGQGHAKRLRHYLTVPRSGAVSRKIELTDLSKTIDDCFLRQVPESRSPVDEAHPKPVPKPTPTGTP